MQCVNRILNGSSTAIPVFTFCGNLPVYLHRFINTLRFNKKFEIILNQQIQWNGPEQITILLKEKRKKKHHLIY